MTTSKDGQVEHPATAPLRLVVWNCAMALDRKWDALLSLKPDIAVVSECARPEIIEAKRQAPLGTRDALWAGRWEHKGLGVFTFGPWSARLHDDHSDELEYVLPVTVNGPADFLLLGVWAQNHRAKRSPEGVPPGRQVQLGVDRYAGSTAGALVVAGDFNHNVIWDGPRPGSRSMRNCIDVLEGRGLASAYHAFSGETYGEETRPTHYWEARGGAVNTYHIDYGWIPQSWSIEHVDVGSREAWYDAKVADHSPITCDIRIPIP